jgi:hypothetical protein
LTTAQQAYVSGAMKANVVKTVTSIKTGVVTAATWAATTAQVAWTAAIKFFSKAIYGIPVFGWILAILAAITGAVVLLVKNWDKLTKLFSSSTKEIEDNTKAVEKQNAAYHEQKRILDKKIDDEEYLLKIMQAQKADNSSIFEQQKKILNLKIQDLRVDLQRIKAMGIITTGTVKQYKEIMDAIREYKIEIDVLTETEKTRIKEIAIANKEKANKEKAERIKEKAEFLEMLRDRQATEFELLEKARQSELDKLAKMEISIKEFNEAVLLIEKEYNEKKNELNVQFSDEQKKVAFERQKAIRENAEKELEETNKVINQNLLNQYANESLLLKQKYANNLITLEEFQKQQAILDNDLLNGQLVYLQQHLDNTLLLYGENASEVQAIKQAIIDKENEIQDAQLEKEIERNTIRKEKMQEMADEIGAITGQASELLANFLLSSEKNMAEFYKGIGALLLDSLEKAVLAAVVEAGSKELATKGFPAGLITGAIVTGLIKGAFAGVKSKLLAVPQYAKGREGGKSEFAIVGEKGSELIVNKSGDSYLSPDKPTLTYLPAGASVIPHEKTKGLVNNVNFKGVERRLDNVVSAINGKAELNITESGIYRIVRKNNVTTKYINNLR